MISIQNILVPVDLTQAAVHAAQYAAALAQAHQARLFVLHVKAPYPVHGRIAGGALEHVQNQRMRKEQTELSELIPDSNKDSIWVTDIQVTGSPRARVIIEKALELDVDLIVMPVQQPQRWMRFFKENVIQQVIQKAPCSVFVVRRRQNPSDPSHMKPP